MDRSFVEHDRLRNLGIIAGVALLCIFWGYAVVVAEWNALFVGIAVLACMLVAFFLNGMVSFVGVAGGYVFNVVLQDGTPGAYLASFTALAQIPDLLIGLVKALVFGLIAAIVASYMGMNAGGGPKGVGDAVNESVVITFLLLFIVNFTLSAIYLEIVPPKTG